MHDSSQAVHGCLVWPDVTSLCAGRGSNRAFGGVLLPLLLLLCAWPRPSHRILQTLPQYRQQCRSSQRIIGGSAQGHHNRLQEACLLHECGALWARTARLQAQRQRPRRNLSWRGTLRGARQRRLNSPLGLCRGAATGVHQLQCQSMQACSQGGRGQQELLHAPGRPQRPFEDKFGGCVSHVQIGILQHEHQLLRQHQLLLLLW
mmetsp:Transcript_20632/g.57560  ORF Transcript_20632/g.57560 Transcript_20632/m.57560 type:complete len:204 (+) Transcript_20632:1969-2580(+)